MARNGAFAGCHKLLQGGGTPHGTEVTGVEPAIVRWQTSVVPKRGMWRELKMNNIYVPKDEITSLPSGWNEEGTVLHFEYAYTPFDFLNDLGEDVYSLEDGEEIK